MGTKPYAMCGEGNSELCEPGVTVQDEEADLLDAVVACAPDSCMSSRSAPAAGLPGHHLEEVQLDAPALVARTAPPQVRRVTLLSGRAACGRAFSSSHSKTCWHVAQFVVSSSSSISSDERYLRRYLRRRRRKCLGGGGLGDLPRPKCGLSLILHLTERSEPPLPQHQIFRLDAVPARRVS